MPNRKEPRLEIEEQQPLAKNEDKTSKKPEVAAKLSASSKPSQEPKPSIQNQAAEAALKASKQDKGQPKIQSSSTNKTTSDKTFKTETVVSSNKGGSSFTAWLGVFLAVVALGIMAWLFMQTKQQQQSMQHLANRVQELEIRLHETGDDLSAAGSNFNEKLEWADSEIRKLWAIHQVNRPAVEALQNKALQLEKGLSQAEKQLTGVLSASNTATKQTVSLTEDFNNHRSKLKVQAEELSFHIKKLEQRLTEVTLTTSTFDQRLRNQDQSRNLVALEKRVTELNTQVSGILPDKLQAKLLEQEEILASLEASRKQLVSRVTRLMEEVSELQQGR